MTIKSKLQLSTILSTLGAVLIGLFLYGMITSVAVRSGEVEHGSEIIQELSDLKILTSMPAGQDPYVLERNFLEWNSKYEALRKTLSNDLNDPQRHILLGNIRQNFESLGEIFLSCGLEGCMEDRQKQTSIETKFQLLLNSAFQLNDLNQSAYSNEERIVKLSFFLAIAMLIFILVGTSYFTRTNIVEPLSALAEEAKIVSRGKFRNLVGVFKDDEVGNLAKTFSYMIHQLKTLQQGMEDKVLRRTAQLSLKISELEKTKKIMDTLLQDLQKLNAQDKIVLRSIGEGMVITNREGIITYVNKTFEELFKINLNQLKSKKIFEVVTQEDPKKNEENFLHEAIITGKKLNNLSGYQYTDSEKKIPLSITVSPFKSNGTYNGFIVLLHDRSKEQEIDEMKKKFLAFVADQLRTPLGSMRWNLEMLMENEKVNKDPEMRSNLSQMHENNQRILELINQLLDVSNIKNGDLEKRIKSLTITDDSLTNPKNE